MTSAGRTLPIGLFLVASALCAAIGWEITSPMEEQEVITIADAVLPARGNTAAAFGMPQQHDGWFRTILARPLFSPDRKPIGASTRNVAGLPRLTGIVVSGSRRIAIFAAGSGGRPIVAEAGSHVGAYDVQDVTEGGVTVMGPEGITVVRPIFDAASAVTTKPALAVRPDLPRPGARQTP